MKRIFTLLVLIHLLAFAGCISFLNGPRKTLAEVEFEGAHFGSEYIPDPSLEGYNETYYTFYQPRGSEQRRYFKSQEDGLEFSHYPKDPANTLKGVRTVIVDTVKRTFEKKRPEEVFTTVYVDPKIFDKAAFDCFEKFVTASFKHPDPKNPVLLWMNKAYNVADKPDSLFFMDTIYAIVYASLDQLEPQYISPDGKTKLKVTVDHWVHFTKVSEPKMWGGVGPIKDSTFFYDRMYEKDYKTFAEYASSDKKKFGDWYMKAEEWK